MTSYDDDDDKLCLISLSCLEGVGPVSIRRLLWGANERGIFLKDAVALPQTMLAGRFGLKFSAARAIAAVADHIEAGRAILKRVLALGVRPVFEGESDYPQRLSTFLGSSAPPLLYTSGDMQVLDAPTVAIVGSRQPSRHARAAATRFASAVAAARTVVSGGAVGIDSIAQAAALPAGAVAVAPALGISRFRWSQVDPSALESGRWCLLGQFDPQASWSVRNALLRNHTIVALGDAVVAFEPRDTGGTWHSSLLALKMRKPLFVVCCSDAAGKQRGLEHLLRFGAAALDVADMPDADAFDRMVRDYRPPPQPLQLPLFNEVSDAP